jgi:type VI secretion system protein ImpH
MKRHDPPQDDLAPPSVMLPPRAPTTSTERDHIAMQALWAKLADAPYAHDFFQVLRTVQAHNPSVPRLGEALRPRDEAVRLGQDPELNFAPANLNSFTPSERGVPPRIGQRAFGLFGSMGPLPLHLTEYARERTRNHGDPTMMRFADVFHHRAMLLFFRAWAQSRPVVHRDRPWDDDFARWVSALFGQSPKTFSRRDTVPDDAKRVHAAALARGPRNAEGLVKILKAYFGIDVHIDPSVGHWLELQHEDRSRLLPSTSPGRNTALGQRAVLGKRVWDRQSHISRVALFGKLNRLAYKAIEGATVFCKLRGNPYVELVHWIAADPADARLRPAPHRPALRDRCLAAGQGHHRGARPAAARRDLDLRLLHTRRERGRARLGLRRR